jgi:hypothetical protein
MLKPRQCPPLPAHRPLKYLREHGSTTSLRARLSSRVENRGQARNDSRESTGAFCGASLMIRNIGTTALHARTCCRDERPRHSGHNVEAGGRLREACPARGETCEQAAKLKVAFEIVVQRRNKRAPLAFRSYPGMCIA